MNILKKIRFELHLYLKTPPKGVCYCAALFALSVLAPISAFAQTLAPVVVGRQGYINGTPLTAHTTAAFNSVGATTLVAFVSTNTPWNSQPVGINGLSDNLG